MIKRIKFLLIAFLTFCLLVTICHFLFRTNLTGEVITLKDGWSIEYDGNVYENVKLIDIPGSLNIKPKKGDVFSITTTIPKSSSYTFPTLLFQARYSAYDFLVDGDQIMCKYKDLWEKGKFIGSTNNIIRLSYSDKPLTITIKL